LLIVTIPDWLAKRLGIEEGTPVIVDNQNGKFNITLDRSVQ
jgi:bifunctional DNA-binding transcriptional regulator/antitoxin component of YhaV-PrlF toxin-antitoxin module